MPDSQFYTQQAALAKAGEIKTALALSKLCLFKADLSPNQFTTKAELEAAECDFDGYTSGGYTLTAWTGPLIDPNGGAILTSPLVNIAYGPAEDPPVTNSVGGWWIEDASGDVRLVGTYNPPRNANMVGAGWPFVAQIVEARNPVVGVEE